MTDREKVINELNDCLENQHIAFMDGVGDIYAVSEETIRNVISLLKEQEAMQVKTDMYGNAYCPWCSTDRTIEMGLLRLHLGTLFCPYCGKAVKWHD